MPDKMGLRLKHISAELHTLWRCCLRRGQTRMRFPKKGNLRTIKLTYSEQTDSSSETQPKTAFKEESYDCRVEHVFLFQWLCEAVVRGPCCDRSRNSPHDSQQNEPPNDKHKGSSLDEKVCCIVSCVLKNLVEWFCVSEVKVAHVESLRAEKI